MLINHRVGRMYDDIKAKVSHSRGKKHSMSWEEKGE